MAKTAKDKKEKTSAKNLVPTAGHILIEPFEAQTKTNSGIYLPDSANKEKPQKGKVLACGYPIFKDGKEIESPAQVGETVVYRKWGGDVLKEGDKEFTIVKFEDILAVEK